MSIKKKLVVLVILAIGSIGFSTSFSKWMNGEENDYYSSIRKNTILFGEVYKQIADKYVEKVDPEKLMRVGINAMLDSVDPYTVLIEDEDNVQLQIITQGKYGGLGMLVGYQDSWPTVVEPPYEGTPAMKAGIREGDKIIEIDGVSTKEKNVSEVASKLRGEKGTAVTIKIRRQGEPEPIEFRLIRAEIVINDVEYGGMINDEVGYIKLTRFSKNAAREVADAVRKLQQENAKGIVLDLRNNPGGLLEAAVGVSDVFLPKGKLIVSTRGRSDETVQEYFSERDAIADDLPLVVLINGLSASASEIVSGAIQDLDRGVVIGRKSFGKGLVQSVVGLTRDARLKLTTAKYYLPSGRLIQKDHYSEDILLADADANSAAEMDELESAHPRFQTAVGRSVYGGGGIEPDIEVEADTLTHFESALIRQSMIFNYAVVYAASHENLKKGFDVTPEILSDFHRFLDEKGFDYSSKAEEELDAFRDAAEKEGFSESVKTALAQIEKQIELAQKDQFAHSEEFIKRQLAMEISAKLWDTQTKIEAGFRDDKDLEAALTLLSDKASYEARLSKIGK
ncbi:MAG: S41 family peptidase [Deferribacteres bacterium]|nr:S41 family peptidase [Deferribacteres bacterium]